MYKKKSLMTKDSLQKKKEIRDKKKLVVPDERDFESTRIQGGGEAESSRY